MEDKDGTKSIAKREANDELEQVSGGWNLVTYYGCGYCTFGCMSESKMIAHIEKEHPGKIPKFSETKNNLPLLTQRHFSLEEVNL